MNEANGSGDRFKYFMVGGAIGALAALFFAPRSGKETRELIAHKAQDGKEAIGEGARKGKERIVEKRDEVASEAKELINKAKNISSKEKEIVLEAIEAGRKAYTEEIESLRK